jgi:hypothetical protein
MCLQVKGQDLVHHLCILCDSQLTPDISVTQSVTPASAPLVPGNQPVFTFTSIVRAAAGSGRVNNARLSVALSAGLARTGDVLASPNGASSALAVLPASSVISKRRCCCRHMMHRMYFRVHWHCFVSNNMTTSQGFTTRAWLCCF